MFKLSKSMHMMIILSFTVVFVAVYLYYMIKDVRKMYNEVKKHTQEIDTLKKSFDDIQTNITSLATTLSAPNAILNSQDQIAFQNSQVNFTPEIVQHYSKHIMENQSPIDIQHNNHSYEDDIASVETEDIKKLIEDDREDDTNINIQKEERDVNDDILIMNDFNNDVMQSQSLEEENIDKMLEETTEDTIEEDGNIQPIYTESSLKKMKFDELKDICKKMSISTKGTRDVLIGKILEAVN